MNELEGCLWTSEGWRKGKLVFASRILSIEGAPIDAPEAPFILPGFVDLHVHGGAGADMMEGRTAIQKAAEFHASCGTTSLLATSVTAPHSDIEGFLESVAELMNADTKGRARILGAHLEGPFLNPEKLGAQPPFARAAELKLVKKWVEIAPVKVMTIAPEMDADNAVISWLQSQGIKLQIGHSLCDYARAAIHLQSGFGVTHLFNAMTPLTHRDNGIAGAALAHADYAEIIPDLIHVEAGALLAARRAIPHLYGVTDAMAGAGMKDGKFRLGAHEVTKSGDKIQLEDGTLAGSVLTMDQALRNLVGVGLPLGEAAWRLSTLPANWIGAHDIGRIETGALADIVVFDNNLEIIDCYINGSHFQE